MPWPSHGVCVSELWFRERRGCRSWTRARDVGKGPQELGSASSASQALPVAACISVALEMTSCLCPVAECRTGEEAGGAGFARRPCTSPRRFSVKATASTSPASCAVSRARPCGSLGMGGEGHPQAGLSAPWGTGPLGSKQLDIWLKLQLGREALKGLFVAAEASSSGTSWPERVGVAAWGTRARLGKFSTANILIFPLCHSLSLRRKMLLAQDFTSP